MRKIEEGRAFVAAAQKAKDAGDTEFEFNGKTYPVTLKDKKVEETHRVPTYEEHLNEHNANISFKDLNNYLWEGPLGDFMASVQDYTRVANKLRSVSDVPDHITEKDLQEISKIFREANKPLIKHIGKLKKLLNI